MDKIKITGGARLNGEIAISGAKNSALKLMAAVLLTDEELILENMPRLADTRSMAHLLAHLGAEAHEENHARLRLRAAKIDSTTAPYDLVRKMRATFNVLGPLLAREHKARVSLPGGCAIGARPVNLHLQALECLGADITLDQGYVDAVAKGGLKGAPIKLEFPSVGATEHAMLAAVLAKGETTISNAAREPEIIDLADCLNAMGAQVRDAGEETISITGVERLSGATYPVVADRIETGTYALAVAATGGSVTLKGARIEHNDALWTHMRETGADIAPVEGGVRVARNTAGISSTNIETGPYPEFPTDLQAQFMALMTIADGVSVIRERVFENRFMHAPELMRMGADIAVHGSEARVRGVARLRGAPVMATDLRASVSLVVAGLVAEGETTVARVYHLDRGFERLEEKLSNCGAQIVRENDG